MRVKLAAWAVILMTWPWLPAGLKETIDENRKRRELFKRIGENK
jgi:hypothetical protein